MNEVLVELSALVPDEQNSRRHDEKNILLIQRNYEKFGQYRPLVVQKSSMRVLAGNGLLQAMKHAGVTGKVKAVIMDIDDGEANALAILDNRSHDLSSFDCNLLFAQLEKFDNGLKSLLDYDSMRRDSELNEEAELRETPEVMDGEKSPGTNFVLGEYRIHLTQKQFLAWREELQINVGFAPKDQKDEIKRRIGLNED